MRIFWEIVPERDCPKVKLEFFHGWSLGRWIDTDNLFYIFSFEAYFYSEEVDRYLVPKMCITNVS